MTGCACSVMCLSICLSVNPSYFWVQFRVSSSFADISLFPCRATSHACRQVESDTRATLFRTNVPSVKWMDLKSIISRISMHTCLCSKIPVQMQTVIFAPAYILAIGRHFPIAKLNYIETVKRLFSYWIKFIHLFIALCGPRQESPTGLLMALILALRTPWEKLGPPLTGVRGCSSLAARVRTGGRKPRPGAQSTVALRKEPAFQLGCRLPHTHGHACVDTPALTRLTT